MDVPASETELVQRARGLGGVRIGELARELAVKLPAQPQRAKGFVGTLVERALGATARSRPEPDFPSLGVELKTLPIDSNGRIRESTFVCSAAIGGGESPWVSSSVRRKLARVLWLAVEADPSVPLAARRIGAAFLWSPDRAQEELLRTDFEGLMERLALGDVERVDARRGKALQLRPKAADAAVRTRAFDADGSPCLAAPRGFYLRRWFTSALLARERLIGAKEA